jgi:uncharacterized protein (TIGR03437 family)
LRVQAPPLQQRQSGNFQMPERTGNGATTLTVLRDGATVGQGSAAIESVTPGLFAANANGQGEAHEYDSTHHC